MRNLVLIGAGQLGSRHLQALSKVNFPTKIEVVDPLPASLDVARSRFNEMPFNPNISGINFYSSLNDISKEIDLAIVATNADVRADVIRMLISSCNVKNLVLEKVLFQKVEDYVEILSLLEGDGINAWVNHPRRMFQFYKKLKQLLNGSRKVSYQVQGGGWGLACNGLHLIDHLAFLTGESGVEINILRLDQSVLPSKRSGFLEISGSLSGRVGPHFFELFCHEVPSPMLITIFSDNINVIIDEANGWVKVASKENGWKWREEKENIIHLQSELSNKLAEEILETGQCALPTLAEASSLHVLFINALLEHFNRNASEKHSFCPIT